MSKVMDSLKDKTSDAQNFDINKLKIPKNIAQVVVFNCLSAFTGYFTGLKLKFEMCREIILHFCKRYELDQQRTHLLLHELEQAQMTTLSAVTFAEIRKISLDRKNKISERFGNYQIPGMVLSYIADDQTLTAMTALNKGSRTVLKPKVIECLLLSSSPDQLTKKRPKLWHQILDLDGLQMRESYAQLKWQFKANPKCVSHVEEVISLDVERSQSHFPGLDSEVLSNMLKAYAIHNPKVEYCQGMNYLAGLLLQVFKNSEVAFKALVVVMERHKVTDLVNPDLPLLKMFFYQIDTLMGLVDPSLHKHMKEEGLSSTLFASKWFITVFTSVPESITPNSDDDARVNESLLQIWDNFLVKGWPALVKVAAYLLSTRRS